MSNITAETCLDLISSTGTRLYFSVLKRGLCYPEANDFLIQDTLIPGDTSLKVAPLVKAVKKGEEIKLYQALFTSAVTLIGTETVATDAAIGATSITIEPASNIALSGDYGRSIGLFELLGIESSPFQSQTEMNQVTLLRSNWQAKSPGSASWNLSITGYIPGNLEASQGYSLIADAYRQGLYLYIERHLPNGDVKAGTTAVSSFSDQVQGAGYIQYQATLEGHDAPEFDLIVPRNDDIPNPTPIVILAVPKAALVNESQALTATVSITGDTISSVQFQVNGINEGAAATISPYSRSWTPTSKGTYVVRAIALASQGGTATTNPLEVSVFDTKLIGGETGAGCSLGAQPNSFILFDNNVVAGAGLGVTMAINVGGIQVGAFNYLDDVYGNRDFAFFHEGQFYLGKIQTTVSF